MIISGTGFDANTGVLFGQATAPSVSYDPVSGDLTVVVPSYVGPIVPEPIPVTVVVAPQNSNPCTQPGGFNYENPICQPTCSITNLTPNSGPVAGGNTVTVTGTDFCNNLPQMEFNGQPGTVSFVSPSQLDVLVPASVSGPGPVAVTYQDNGGCFTGCGGCYTYN